MNKEEIISSLEWALNQLDKFVYISHGAAFSFDGTEHVGYTVKYKKIKSLLYKLKEGNK